MLRTFQDCDDVEGLVICLELVLRELIAQEHLAGLDENEEAACELVKTSLGYLRVLADDNEIQQDQAPPVVYTGSVGCKWLLTVKPLSTRKLICSQVISNLGRPTLIPVYTTGGA